MFMNTPILRCDAQPAGRVLRSAETPMSANLGFASAVAEFGMLLRNSEHKGSASYEGLAARARRRTPGCT